MIKKKKGFTLIELITVLVTMAILVLLAAPLVMSIIRKAKISADKRSIDAYGRSIELAIARYLMDTGDFPTSIEQLTIEYSGDEVVCTTTNLNSDSSVYLAGCRVGGRSVNYSYGSDKSPTYTVYAVGDEVTYNGVDYYVIKASGAKESTVTMLKAEPLSYAEIQIYSNGTGATISDQNGYGGMYYHSNSNEYATSYIKATVDAWKIAQAPLATEARLIQYDEFTNLGYEWGIYNVSNEGYVKGENTPEWVYNYKYYYWTMSPRNDSTSNVWDVNGSGIINYSNVDNQTITVRPVITLSKSLISE